MATPMGMHDMEDRASIQPRALPHHGYVYSLLYFSGVYLISEKAKVPWAERKRERS